MPVFKAATDEQRELYRNLFNMLQNDLSSYSRRLRAVDGTGYFERGAVDRLFGHAPGVTPYLVYAGRRVAGLLVLATAPYVGTGCDYAIREFFVLGCHRGSGLAEAACRELFATHPGWYWLEVLRGNARAAAFWDKITARYAAVLRRSRTAHTEVYRFRTRARPGGAD